MVANIQNMLKTLGTFYFTLSLFLVNLKMISINAKKNRIAIKGLAFNYTFSDIISLN